jgi:pyruvate kinase
MDRIIRAIEADREANPSAQAAAWTSTPTTADACARAAAKLADDLDCPMVVFTRSGSSAQRVSATRPRQPIHALTPHLPTARRLSLIWGVSADLEPEEPKSFDDILDAVNRHEAASTIKRFVITAGWPYATDNSTDTIKVVERK